MTKRFNSEEKTARKRRKTKHVDEEEPVVETPDETPKAEFLTFKNLREGQILLGCVTEVLSHCLVMSLPGCLDGIVPPNHISKTFTESLQDDSDQDISLDLIAQVGEAFPCKVMSKQSFKETKKGNKIILSIDPRDVHGELREPLLYENMVLYATVESSEDHGYVMDLGMKGVHGFLPTQWSGTEPLTRGRVVPTYLRKMPTSKGRPIVHLCLIGQDEAFPQIEDEYLKLNSILPGATLKAMVMDTTPPFVQLSCGQFCACASVVSVGKTNKNLSPGKEVVGTVLYVHPITRLIYLMLRPRPTPSTFDNYFRVKKFDFVKDAHYQSVFNNKLLVKLKFGLYGVMSKWDFSKDKDLSHEELTNNPLIPRARVTHLHYMDNLVQLSVKESMLEMVVRNSDDIAIGEILQGRVLRHTERGMFVSLSQGLKGFVSDLHLSDVFVTMPEKIHPVGSTVQCRVLSRHPQFGLTLTCKESLLSLPEDALLLSYEDATPGHSHRGVVVKKDEDYMLVLFFNEVKGIVHKDHIPRSSIFYVGQCISCEVLQSDPSRQRLKLSLLDDKPKKIKKATPKNVSDERKLHNPHQEISTLDLPVRNPDDIAIGEILPGRVLRHTDRGMLVGLSPDLKGFVFPLQISDVFVTMPEKIHPVGSNVQCRVLSRHHHFGLSLTCKESLLSSPEDALLLSYEDATPGHSYRGVVVKKDEDYMLVLFFNDVKGIVHKDHIPRSSIFYVGQCISCTVLKCDPSKQRLKLALMNDKPVSKRATTKNELKPHKPQQADTTHIKPTQLDVVNGNMKGHMTGRYFSEKGSSSQSRLTVTEDIDWNEM